jgi:CBS domain-containing protein
MSSEVESDGQLLRSNRASPRFRRPQSPQGSPCVNFDLTPRSAGPLTVRVADVMTGEVVTVSPGASLKEAAELLVENRISGLPVVDNEGGVLGVVSEADVLAKEAQGLETHESLLSPDALPTGRTKLDARVAGEAMTSPAVTIEANRPIALAAKLMIEEGVNRLPVVEDGKLVGIVTRADLVRAFVRTDAEIAEEIRADVVVHELWLDKHSVRVQVDNGEVTLAGRTNTHADAVLLQALVAKVPGVVAIRSELTWAEDDAEC